MLALIAAIFIFVMLVGILPTLGMLFPDHYSNDKEDK